MAANINKKEQQAKVSKMANLFRNLDLSKDERLTREPMTTGYVSHFWTTFKKNYSDLMIANLLFMLFALPAVLIIFWMTPTLINSANAFLDFNGDMGIGFGGKYDTILGMMNIYNTYEIMFLALIPCFTLMGLGMAGLFYCCRNFLWGAPVRIRVHFWRGIKKRWAEFLLAFTYLGGVVAMMGCSILEYMKADLNGYVNAGHWIFMIASALIFLLSVLYLMVSLPMEVSFRYKMGSVIKNTCILSVAMIVPMIIVLILLAIPMLMMLNSFLRMIFYVAVAMIGFSFYVLAVSALGHNMFDSVIIPLYEHDLRQKEKEEKKERDRLNREKNRQKSKKKRK